MLWPTELSGHLELCCLSKLSSVYPLCILVFQKAFKAWRRRQDSNLHRVAPERFSRPWQYQLCLLLHMRVLFFMRIPAHWVTRFLPRAGLDLLFINRLKMLSSALGGEGGIRTLAPVSRPTVLAGPPLIATWVPRHI